VFRSYLENEGIEVTSVDFDESRNPDFVGEVAQLDDALPPDLVFDLVACFQVLEHLPFSELETCLAGIARRTTSHALISLPHHGAQVRLAGALSTLRFSFGFYVYPPTRFRPTKQHEWEIDRIRPVRRISKIMSKYFEIEDSYFVKENPYHYFWVLRRRTAPR
jgi:2-polyprenyl-3-methyl-5-hydroxy-6-metoxy-1,4-benzoquinol methylase